MLLLLRVQAAGTERLFTLRSAMAIATGEAEEAEREAEVVERRSSKGPHSRKDGNPLGWLALGRGARGRGFGRSSGVHFGWKKSVLITNTRVPYKVYNSVPLVLYLKLFRTTGCTG